jgi:hypothetical protein
MILSGNVPCSRPGMLQGILSDQRHISAKSAFSAYGTDEVAGSAGATATDGLGSSFQGTSPAQRSFPAADKTAPTGVASALRLDSTPEQRHISARSSHTQPVEDVAPADAAAAAGGGAAAARRYQGSRPKPPPVCVGSRLSKALGAAVRVFMVFQFTVELR